MSETVPVQPFNTDGEDRSQRFDKWYARLDLYFTIKAITDEAAKINYLLFYGGEQLVDAYTPYKAVGDATINAIADKLRLHFQPPATVVTSIQKFRKSRQHEGETFDEFVARMREWIKPCLFADPESELMHHLLGRCKSDKVKSRAMSDDSLTLAKMIKHGRLQEVIETQMQDWREEEGATHTHVNTVHTRGRYTSKYQFDEGANNNNKFDRGANHQFDRGANHQFDRGANRQQQGAQYFLNNVKGQYRSNTQNNNNRSHKQLKCFKCDSSFPHDVCKAANSECFFVRKLDITRNAVEPRNEKRVKMFNNRVHKMQITDVILLNDESHKLMLKKPIIL